MSIKEKRDEKFREAEFHREQMERALAEVKEFDTLMDLANKHNVELRMAGDVARKILNSVYHRSNDTEKTLKSRVIAGAQEILADGVRRYSRELLQPLEAMGVSIRTRDPASTLSSYLSREKEIFDSDVKAGGWTLKILKRARPEDVGASRASVSTAH